MVRDIFTLDCNVLFRDGFNNQLAPEALTRRTFALAASLLAN